MSILDIFRNKEKVQAPQAAIYATQPRAPIDYGVKENRAEGITYSGVGRTRYAAGLPPTVYDSPITAVRAYPVVYAVITAISEAVSGLGIKVYEVKGGQRVEALDHPFYRIFASPNPHQGSFEFLEQLQQSLDVCGNAFISKEKVAGTFELYVLDPRYVAIIPDPKTRIKKYVYTINGQKIDYLPEEMIHIKYNDLDDPYDGMPPLTTASEVLTFEKNRLKFANNYFVNGAIPVGVLETEQVLGETLLKKLRMEWTQIHQAVKNSHKVGILQGGLKYRAITSPIKDLDFPGLKQLSREDILAIYKVPESILGSQEGTSGSEGKGAITAFWRQCIIPRLKRIESGLNRGLYADVFGNGAYVFEINLKDVVALQEDKQSLSTYIEKMIGASVMTPNEGRAVLGLAKSSDPNADKLMVSNSFYGNSLIPIDAAVSGGAGSTAEKPAAKPPKKPTA